MKRPAIYTAVACVLLGLWAFWPPASERIEKALDRPMIMGFLVIWLLAGWFEKVYSRLEGSQEIVERVEQRLNRLQSEVENISRNVQTPEQKAEEERSMQAFRQQMDEAREAKKKEASRLVIP